MNPEGRQEVWIIVHSMLSREPAEEIVSECQRQSGFSSDRPWESYHRVPPYTRGALGVCQKTRTKSPWLFLVVATVRHCLLTYCPTLPSVLFFVPKF